jgi:hypothetical protein
LATQRENIADMDAKGRRREYKPEDMWNARLSLEDARKIREEKTSVRGEVKALAAKYGISVTQVHRIVSGQCWKDSGV